MPTAESREDRDREVVAPSRTIPATRLPAAAMTAGVERSMPPCMTTSIWPSDGDREDRRDLGRCTTNDVARRASGATNAATTSSATVASHTGRNRAATVASRRGCCRLRGRDIVPLRGGDEGLAATTGHFDQVRATVSMLA